MCGRRQAEERREAYEGETVRLDGLQYAGAGGAQQAQRCGWGAFPWWTLWLIWPLIGLVKWTAPLVAGAYAQLLAASVPLLPVLLILVGLAFIVRRRME